MIQFINRRNNPVPHDSLENDPSLSGADTVHIPSPEWETGGTQVKFAAKTHTGLVRSNNEDQYLVVRLRKSLDLLDTSLATGDRPQLADQEGYVLLVADG